MQEQARLLVTIVTVMSSSEEELQKQQELNSYDKMKTDFSGNLRPGELAGFTWGQPQEDPL